jgi:transcriptional antiterminator NusG
MNDDTKKPIVEEKQEEETAPQATSDIIPVVDEAVEEPVEPVEPVSEPTASVEVKKEAPVEEKVEELEAPEKLEEIEAKEEDGKVEETTTPSSPSDKAKWYIIHTYSGHENKVAKSLKQRIESMGFEERIFDIIVPTRETVKVSQGKKETVKEKIFPGYVLVKMILDDESWLLVRTTQGVTAFIGAGNKPTPISEKEVSAIQKFMAEEEPLYKTSFAIGEAVKIVDGPFADFLGTIDNIDEAKGKLKVLVSIFGRETPVELDFLQVSKL